MSKLNGQKVKIIIPDGLYLITRIDTSGQEIRALNTNEAILYYNPDFDEFNDEYNSRIVVNKSEFVPLQLKEAPSTELQTGNKKKLLLTLNKNASEQLKLFTVRHMNSMVAIVVDSEVLTKHKIKAVIANGALQISRCNDHACELLLIHLKDNVDN